MLYLFLSFLQILHVGQCLSCFDCQYALSISECNKVQTCADGEICTVGQIVTHTDLIVYNVGCKANTACSTSEISLLHPGDVPTCMQCCNTSYCNNQGCGEKEVPINQRGPYCFTCDGIQDPSKCTKVSMCSPYQHCMIRPESNNGNTSYTGFCETASACDALQLYSVNSECPGQCCSTDFCNNACPVTTTPQTVKSVCPADHLYDNVTSLCIKLVEAAFLTYNQAIDVCHYMEDELVTIDSPEKSNFVDFAIIHYSKKEENEREYWIGIQEIKWYDHYVYQWPYHLPINYTNWADNQPSANTHTHCVVIKSNDQYKWHDTYCVRKHYAICEHRPKPTFSCRIDLFTLLTDNFEYMCARKLHLRHTWEKAQGVCRGYGGDLVVINSDEKMALVIGFKPDDNDDFWIGARNSGGNSTFTWVTGEQVNPNTHSWDPNQPDDDTSHACLDINTDNREWHNHDCNKHKRAICEIPVTIS